MVIVVSDTPDKAVKLCLDHGQVTMTSPALYPDEGNKTLTAKRLGILRAMRLAVNMSKPGEIIMQDDVEFNPRWGLAELKPGHITMLAPRHGVDHYCPRAFIIPDEETRELLLDLWEREWMQSCFSWASIPKVPYNGEVFDGVA